MANLQIQKEKFKNFFQKWRNHHFLLNMHKKQMRLICIHFAVQNIVILNQNVIIYIIFGQFLYLFKELY